jgi:pilus assembly protein CpaB
MQNQRAIVFLLLAVLLGLGAAVSVQRWLSGQKPEVVEGVVQTVPVLVARTDIAIGTQLIDKQLKTAEWPTRYVPDGVFSEPEMLAGRVLRRPVAAGEPLLEALLLPEGSEAGLLAVISENMRAVSVKVDPVVGVAGFVKPGTHVDVMVTVRRIDQPKPLPYSKVILQDVRVLAIDQKMEEARNGGPELVSVVTLEVNPKQAEKLIYSAHEGRVQLALRNPGDREIVKTSSAGVVDVLGRRKPKARNGRRSETVQVIKGSKVSVKSF